LTLALGDPRGGSAYAPPVRVLEEARVRIAVAGTTAEAPLVRGRAALAGVEVEAETVEPPGAPSGGPSLEVRWSVANTGAAPVALDSVALVWDAGAMGAEPRLFVNGYQSWSPVGALRLGIDTDPSLDPRPIPLVRAAFHADPGVVAAGTLRSEQIAVLADGGRALAAIGFTGGARHAGTIYARAVDERAEPRHPRGRVARVGVPGVPGSDVRDRGGQHAGTDRAHQQRRAAGPVRVPPGPE